MANFLSLSELLNTTEGMTVLRNNSANDDSVDTVTGVDWFTFNGVVASNVYVSGNSFVGFGSNSEHLKICRRDGKMYYLYRQEGIIGTQKFLKIRWQGYTRYNSTDSQYALVWELFLFDDGGIYLNIVTVPSNSSYLGASQLICGSNMYSFTVTVSAPIDYSFLPDGSGGFTLSEEEYPIIIKHVSSGSIEFSTELIQKVESIAGSKISWEQNTPEGTSVKVYARLTGGSYSQCINGGAVPCLNSNIETLDKTLYIKVEMSTEDEYITPTLSNIFIQLMNVGDDHILLLEFNQGNVNSIQNAAGAIGVAYAGGTLRGLGGAVAPFEQSFEPDGLLAKNNPNVCEHIEIVNVNPNVNLLRIYYTNTQFIENVSVIDAKATGALTHINDI